MRQTFQVQQLYNCLTSESEFLPKQCITKKPDGNLHTCLITDSNQTLDDALKMANQLIFEGVKHVSILKGGFKSLSISIKQQKDCSIM